MGSSHELTELITVRNERRLEFTIGCGARLQWDQFIFHIFFLSGLFFSLLRDDFAGFLKICQHKSLSIYFTERVFCAERLFFFFGYE